MAYKDITYKMTIRLWKDEKLFGPGIASLLKYVDTYKSLNKAAAHMDMAYSKAWKIIKETEKQLDCELLTRRIGGTGGGGAILSKQGRELLVCYEAFVEEADKKVGEIFLKYFGE